MSSWIEKNWKSLKKDVKKNVNSAWDDLTEGDFGEFLDPFDLLDEIGLDPVSVEDIINKVDDIGDMFKPVDLPDLPAFDPNQYAIDTSSLNSSELPESILSKIANNPNTKKVAIALVIILLLMAFKPEIQRLVSKNVA